MEVCERFQRFLPNSSAQCRISSATPLLRPLPQQTALRRRSQAQIVKDAALQRLHSTML